MTYRRLTGPAESYDALVQRFRWPQPTHFNIGVETVDRHATDPERLALIYERDDGSVERYTFARIKDLSDRFALALRALGLVAGDRVAILLPQAPDTAISHAAIYKSGAIALPLFTQFGPDALRYRLSDSGARVVITNPDNLDKVMALRAELPELQHVIVTGAGQVAGTQSFERLIDQVQGTFEPVNTQAEDPALIIYTSGTTGNPKGALHAHRVLLGHLPGVELPHEFFPQPDDLFWTPADWAWIGGLLDVLLPAWYYGVPVLAHRFPKFDPEQAFELMARHSVRNSFLPPTALKLMRQVPDSRQRFGCQLRSIGSGGETLGSEILDWGRETFGLEINEFYGQTECNLIVGNCAGLMPVRPGSMGRAIPGHEVAIVDESGQPLPDGTDGLIAVHRLDPAMMLRYWNRPEATEEKFIGDWLLTGDMGRRDSDGYFWYLGRTDDVITSAGYRIGPAEIEDCLLRHPAVAMAAVIGVPDKVRTEVVKAFVVLAPGHTAEAKLAEDIQQFVRQHLAAYETPREVAFVEELPLTTTGKVMRRVLREQEPGRR
ncbi:MAG: acyl-CoA synthetase [Natronospirillum sp.]|uniref:acyl-CoA synthetase n=1 Tax=Natronospirillum sp. TaxID=2812955 RepID=UPI0025CEF062|nr:acyl-CoA synthetase [Natronospirillum sp.]MCH8550881.1 acyl-CoA synthetase [Natronospirillum sp.]